MTMSFKAGNHVRFAEALVAISIYANAFYGKRSGRLGHCFYVRFCLSNSNSEPARAGDAGGTPPLASHAPSVSPFEQEVTSLENRRIEFSQRPIIF